MKLKMGKKAADGRPDLRINFKVFQNDTDFVIFKVTNIKASDFLKAWPDIRRKLE